MDVPWSPHGIDGRHFDWAGLAAAADLLFVMAYDMQSQAGGRATGARGRPVRDGAAVFVWAAHRVPWASFPDQGAGRLAAHAVLSACMHDACGTAQMWRFVAALRMLPSPLPILSPAPCRPLQIWGSCVASANAPLALVRRGLGQWLELGVPANKLVLGLPW